MKNILITGGGFHNKGAQAMTFIAVSELKKRFPEHRLIVISDKDVALMDQEDYIYNFDIMRTSLCIPHGFYLLGGMAKLYAMKQGLRKKDVQKSMEVWKNTEYIVDVSGYALGSNWNNATSMCTALWAALAKKYNAKSIYMPQSFGPFAYHSLRGKLVSYCIGKYMKKADVACAREEVGMRLLQEKYHLKNVMKSPDLVLQNKEIHLDAIYKKVPNLVELDIKPHSVGIVPNTETIRYMEKEKVLSMYKKLIERLLRAEYTVYVLAHAKNDIGICTEIKNLYPDNENVIEITNEFSCLEFDINVAKFEFLIASRFHSVVHAYRHSVPCVIVGWAEKYRELAKLCGQEEFTFEVKEGIDIEKLCASVDSMIGQTQKCSDIIRNKIEQVQQENVFDMLEKL